MDKGKLAAAASEFEKREVKIKKTTFYFDEMPPMEAFDLLEELRPGIASAFGMLREGMTFEVGLVVLFLGLPQETVRNARDALYKHVRYRTPQIQTPQRVFDEEDTAFGGCSALDMYEVILRAFSVNFTESFLGMQSRMDEILGSERSKRKTSTRSSQSSSSQSK